MLKNIFYFCTIGFKKLNDYMLYINCYIMALVIHYEQRCVGHLGHLETKNNNTLHKFLNTSFNGGNIDGNKNITSSKMIIYADSKEVIKYFPDLYKIFYNTPNACEDSQYSEFISAVLYNTLYSAEDFISEGIIIQRLRDYHDDMEGISPPDMYMSNMRGKPTLVSVTRYGSVYDLKNRCYNLITKKITKALSSIYAMHPIFKTDRCIIQVFCKSELNATILKNIWCKLPGIPSNIYLHIVICQHEKIYNNNNYYGK